MNIQDLGSLGEFIAAIATIATLVYLAIQIRQNTQSVRITAETALSHHFAEWSAEVVRDPDLGRIWDVAASDPDSLTDDERRRYLWYVAQLFLLYEGQFHLYLDGHIPERTWKPKSNFVAALLKLPMILMWWESRIAPFSDEFFEYIQLKRQETESMPDHLGLIETLNQLQD